MYFTDDWPCQKLFLSLVEFEFHPSSFLPPTLFSLVLLGTNVTSLSLFSFLFFVFFLLTFSYTCDYVEGPIYNDTRACLVEVER